MILFATVDGQTTIERSNVNARYIEMRDGYHPITNDSVWQDSKRLRAPIMFIPEGVLGPLGSDMAERDVRGMLLEVEIIKRSHRNPSISKMWIRKLAALFDWIFKRGSIIMLMLMFGYVFITMATQGG